MRPLALCRPRRPPPSCPRRWPCAEPTPGPGPRVRCARGGPARMRLADKVTIITGAGGGMGRVAARMFAEQGAKVVVAEYGEAAGRETVDEVTRAGGQATFIK